MVEDDSNDFTINSLDEKTRKANLLKEELEVNFQEQILVNKRISLIKETFKTMPNTESDYAILLTQVEMDQIQLDELKYRENELKARIFTYLNS
ncbi:MAG: hypothetical protein KR126chlam6_00708 [Candidatus Anoxychlamydiales bacterium]|nr:hypothetical protein [Candidatus Anoxychlamydiales bacterium]